MLRRLKQLRRRRPRLTIAVVAIAHLVLILPWALLRTPGWYAPPEIEPQQRQRVRNNLVAAEQAFTETLRANPGVFSYHLYQDDLNQWLAMRREIYPLVEEHLPRNISDPFVVFDDDTITLAVRYRTGMADVVLSMDLEVAFKNEGLQLQASRMRCGSVPVPLAFGGFGLQEAIHLEPNEAWRGSPLIHGDLDEGLRIDAHARWANGGLDYRVLDASVTPGVLTFTVEAVPEPSQQARNDHS